MNETIAITGASGFIGNHLKNYFREKGHTVIALMRRNENDDPDIRSFNLETPGTITTSLFENIEIVVHCAFVKDRNENGTDANLTGTKAMIETAKKAGVRKFVFFSTTSAHEEAASFYGQSKLNVEKLFCSETDVVLKCGLVIGDGGLFKQMLSFALTKKIIPILNKGRQLVQFISLDSVATALDNILQTNASGTYVLAQPQSITYKQMFLNIKKYFRIRLILVPVPFFFLKTVLSLADRLNIHLPITKENLLGLKAMKVWQNTKDAERLQLPNERFGELLKKYFSQQVV